jgi:phage N-6-adenine-methyltransferase
LEEELAEFVGDGEPADDGKATPHVLHNSGNDEWGTPREYVEAARKVLGRIDLDPATSPLAQETVRAARFYTKADDGLTKPWRGRVWLNPPYSSGLVEPFMAKLCQHVEAGEVTAAVTLTNNCTETKWFRPAAALARAACFPDGRVKFLNEKGQPTGAPLQGQACLYFGPDVQAFLDCFGAFGLCWVK